jgi:hypothetical protein
MTNIEFKQWKDEHSEFMQEHIKATENSRWGRVLCNWKEEKQIKGQDPSIIDHIDHFYAATVNLKNADIYLDCRPRKIWAKFSLYSILQPIVLTAKTFYHLILPISIPCIIYKTIQDAKKEEKKVSGKELTNRIFKQIGKNILDIGRTPLYAIALTVIGISAVIIGPLAPKILHDMRKTAGNIEKSLNWGNADSAWILFKCFQPVDNIMTIDQWDRTYIDTSYHDENEKDASILNGLSNFARAQIKFRREHPALFNDCLQKYPEDKPYISAHLMQK